MSKVPNLKFNDGREMPCLGLGTYASGGSKNKECQKSVEAALECGYRHIDTAAFYQNEEEVGDGIKNAIKKGVVKREDIFVTTKLWNNRHEYDKVVPTLKESLTKLGLDYVDLYLIHWPVATNDDGSFSDVDYLDTWRGFEKCRELGLAKSIGVSNFNIQQLERLMSNSKTVPVVNQVEINLNNTQKKLIEYCKSKGIVATAYSPFGSLIGARKSEKYPPNIDDPLLTALGKKYNKSVTQIAIRYLIDCGVAAIPKSTTPSRIADNLNIFDFALTPDELAELDKFNRDYRVIGAEWWKDHKHFPF